MVRRLAHFDAYAEYAWSLIFDDDTQLTPREKTAYLYIVSLRHNAKQQVGLRSIRHHARRFAL